MMPVCTCMVWFWTSFKATLSGVSRIKELRGKIDTGMSIKPEKNFKLKSIEYPFKYFKIHYSPKYNINM